MNYTFFFCSLVSVIIAFTVTPCLCDSPAPNPSPPPNPPANPQSNTPASPPAGTPANTTPPKPDVNSPCCVKFACDVIDPENTQATDPSTSKSCSKLTNYVYSKGDACPNDSTKYEITCCPILQQ